MHHFLGYSWSEIAFMLGVLSLIFSGFYGLVIHSGKAIDRKINQMFEPFSRKIDSLNEILVDWRNVWTTTTATLRLRWR